MGLIWKNDPAFLMDAARLSKVVQIRPGQDNAYAESNAGGTGIVIKAGTMIPLKSGGTWKVYEFVADTEATALDEGVLTLGTDYYGYLCDDGTDAGKLLLSANTTAPAGYTVSNSRKIAGFHYGRVRAVNGDWVPIDSVNGAYGAGWEDDVSTKVVSNSVWDAFNRPQCSPEGMAKIGNFWVDIYLASQAETVSLSNGKLAGGRCQSAYNATPLTGTEDLFWDIFNELAKRSGKRLLALSEWRQAAEGSPQGNDADNVNAWTKTTNTGRNPTGTVARAVSAYNICDCVGNVQEWLDEHILDPRDATPAWYDSMVGQGVGQIYMYGAENLHTVLAGGYWGNGVYAGSRCVYVSIYPWDVHTSVGCRFACDSL